MNGPDTHDCLTIWTNNTRLATHASNAGVDRIGVDLEVHDKAARQAGHETWISPHRLSDLLELRDKIGNARLFARCNPLYEGSNDEIEAVLDAGTEIIMVPNFTCIEQVESFVRMVDGRALVVPLVERVSAIDTIPEFRGLGLSEFHVGLNDLSIELGISNRLRLLTLPLADRIAELAMSSGLSFGMGGLARVGDHGLRVPADLVHARYVQLGASKALIARSFRADKLDQPALCREISTLRQKLADWRGVNPDVLDGARDQLHKATQ
ncbi:MAG: hypothetical protein ABJO27_15355 [Pseudoruegeria sp.]